MYHDTNCAIISYMIDNRYFKCLHCDKLFQTKKKRKYCTRKCRDAAYYQRKREL